MIVGIVGSRRRDKPKDFSDLVYRLYRLTVDTGKPITKIVTGDCRTGGDAFAAEICNSKSNHGIELDVKEVDLPPVGSEYYKFVKAYYKRDEEIAKEPLDYFVALVAPDRTGGTEKTIEYFKKYNKDWEKKLIII